MEVLAIGLLFKDRPKVMYLAAHRHDVQGRGTVMFCCRAVGTVTDGGRSLQFESIEVSHAREPAEVEDLRVAVKAGGEGCVVDAKRNSFPRAS